MEFNNQYSIMGLFNRSDAMGIPAIREAFEIVLEQAHGGYRRLAELAVVLANKSREHHVSGNDLMYMYDKLLRELSSYVDYKLSDEEYAMYLKATA